MQFSEDYFKYMPQSSTGMGAPVPPPPFQQNNNIDSGIFLNLAFLFISHDLPLSYKQEEISYWRNRSAIEVLCGYLLSFCEEENIDDSSEDP